MKLRCILAFAGTLSLSMGLANVIGVRPDYQELYQPYAVDGKQYWNCLSDPSIVLTYDQINDDYCDCPDGSDEPGTNACKVDQSKFYCSNEGHIPGLIAKFKINDGVCDYDVCCDGTDEYLLGGCPNKCKEVHDQYEKFKSDSVRELEEALLVKKLFQDEANRLRKEVADSAQRYREEILIQEQELQSILEQTEEGLGEEEVEVDISGLKFQESIDKVSNIIQINEAKLKERTEKLSQLEFILISLIENYNPNFNDAAVKEAVRGFQDYISSKEEVVEDQAIEISSVLDEILQQYSANKNVAEEQTILSQPTFGEPTFNNMVHHYYNKFIRRFLEPEEEEEEEKGEQQREAEKVTALSKKRSKSGSNIENLQAELKDKKLSLSIVEEDLAVDYGDHDILRSVKGQWVSNKLGEYTYNLGFYDSIYQEGNGNNVHIGRFSNVENGNTLVYINGAKCWNGPQRSAKVELICGVETKLLSVGEPEKCEYHFALLTPIICQSITEKELLNGFKVDLSLL